MFGKTENTGSVTRAILITPAEGSAITAAQDYLATVAANALSARTVADNIARHNSDIQALREQRGAADDPTALNRKIATAQNELAALEDRAAFLQRERAELRASVGSGYNAVMNARSAAIQRASVAFSAELQTCIEIHLAPLLLKGRALGAIGDALSLAAIDGIHVPNPANFNVPLVRAGRLLSAKEDGTLSAECSAIIDALSPLKNVQEQLSRVDAEVQAERHSAKQAQITRDTATHLRLAPGGAGAEPAANPERARAVPVLPRREIIPTTMFPNDPARRSTSSGHMYPENSPELGTREIGQ